MLKKAITIFLLVMLLFVMGQRSRYGPFIWQTVLGGINYSGGNVGMGTTSPGNPLEVTRSGNTNTTVEISTWTANDFVSELLFQRSDSTIIGTLAKTDADDRLGSITAMGVDGSLTVYTAAEVKFIQDATASNDAVPGRITISTSDTTSLKERVRIDDAGNVGIGVTSPTSLLDVDGTINGNNFNIIAWENAAVFWENEIVTY